MKTLLLCLLSWGFVPMNFTDPVFKVEKTFSQQRIHRIERRVLKTYGVNVKINVLARNARNEITNLSMVRFQKNGQQGGSCSSDKFGVLLISRDGCSITDAGHESQVVTP